MGKSRTITRNTLRQDAAPIIRRVLKRTKDMSEKLIRKALREAYPWTVRKGYPYDIWLDEIKRQRGLRKNKVPPAAEPVSIYKQLELF